MDEMRYKDIVEAMRQYVEKADMIMEDDEAANELWTINEFSKNFKIVLSNALYGGR